MPQALLSARGITRAIGPRTILHDVTLDLDDGARVGLIGPNGSGKSTLMRVLAGVVAALEHAILRRGGFELGPVELEIRDQERVLLAGPNGCGKSTVIAALAGRLEPSRGRAKRTAGYEVGQERTTLLAGDGSLVSVTRAVADLDARAALAAIGLDSETVQRPVASLSPGERTRAELATATAAGARLLLLDEPTNHLDIEALQALEAVLEQWPGALVVATHDARLRDGLRIDRTLEITPGHYP